MYRCEKSGTKYASKKYDQNNGVNSPMKHPVDVHVGKRVRHRRWMVGMTQQQLGEAVGIKFQQIQKYETGMNRVSASRLWDIAKAMDVDVRFFFEGIEDGVTDSSPEERKTESPQMQGDLLADKEALELVRSYYSIPENQRRRLFDLARALTDVG
jgi:transcriptional regulator with XRE-family HTH domain